MDEWLAMRPSNRPAKLFPELSSGAQAFTNLGHDKADARAPATALQPQGRQLRGH